MKHKTSESPKAAKPVVAVEQLCAEYRRYLVEERGLVALTVNGYVKTAAEALAGGAVTIPGVSRSSERATYRASCSQSRVGV